MAAENDLAQLFSSLNHQLIGFATAQLDKYGLGCGPDVDDVVQEAWAALAAKDQLPTYPERYLKRTIQNQIIHIVGSAAGDSRYGRSDVLDTSHRPLEGYEFFAVDGVYLSDSDAAARYDLMID